jgi:hypothetical protein
MIELLQSVSQHPSGVEAGLNFINDSTKLLLAGPDPESGDQSSHTAD